MSEDLSLPARRGCCFHGVRLRASSLLWGCCLHWHFSEKRDVPVYSTGSSAALARGCFRIANHESGSEKAGSWLPPALAGPGSTAARARASRGRPGSHCVKVTSGPGSSLAAPPRWLHRDKDSGRSDGPLSGHLRGTVLVTCTRVRRGTGEERAAAPAPSRFRCPSNRGTGTERDSSRSLWLRHGAQVPGRGTPCPGC